MPEFSKSVAKLLGGCVERFRRAFEQEVVAALEAQFRGVRPAEVKDALEELSLLERQLLVRTNPVVVHDAHSRLLKRIILEERRRAAEAIDLPLQKAVDASLIRQLRGTVRPFDQLMREPWVVNTPTARFPKLTDYLSVRYAEQMLSEKVVQLPREYDEKFHILEAPSLFFPDLAYYRARCRLRERSIAVAYMDIDDFKTFNTRYTETKVDLDVLTPFMEAIEAHIFIHGHAYRFGGDEYVVLLPNITRSWAIEMLERLQGELSRANYKGIEEAPTVSIGVCMVEPECWLTDREVLECANEGKATAKANGKGSIAVHEGAPAHHQGRVGDNDDNGRHKTEPAPGIVVANVEDHPLHGALGNTSSFVDEATADRALTDRAAISAPVDTESSRVDDSASKMESIPPTT